MVVVLVHARRRHQRATLVSAPLYLLQPECSVVHTRRQRFIFLRSQAFIFHRHPQHEFLVEVHTRRRRQRATRLLAPLHHLQPEC